MKIGDRVKIKVFDKKIGVIVKKRPNSLYEWEVTLQGKRTE